MNQLKSPKFGEKWREWSTINRMIARPTHTEGFKLISAIIKSILILIAKLLNCV